MTHDFAPRRIGEILDDAIDLVRRNFRTVGPVSAVVLLPIAAAYSVVASFYVRNILDLFGSTLNSATAAAPSTETSIFTVIVVLLLQVLGLLYNLARAMFDGTLYANSAQLLERRRVPLKDALKTGLKSFGWVLLMQMITGAISGMLVFVLAMIGVAFSLFLAVVDPVVMVVGVVLAYVVGFAAAGVAWVLLSLAGPIVVVEGGVPNALRRSVRLVRKHFWRVVLIVIGSALLVTQFESALAAPTIVREIVMGVQSPSGVLGDIAWGWKVFDGLVQGVAISLVLPFSASVTLLTYLDLRARDEGMDLLVRARALQAQ